MSMLVCPLCPDRLFKNDLALQQHRASSKHEPVLCPHCNQGLTSQHALQQHINWKHGRNSTSMMGPGRLPHQGAKSKCAYCDQVFETKKARKAHQKTHQVACRHCSRKFESEAGRSQHEALHTFKCAFCHLVFVTADVRRLHEQYHLNKCRYCTNGFATQYSKNAHEQSCAYNPATIVKCPIIPPDRSTSKSSSPSLNEHKMIETDGVSSTAAVIPHIDDMSKSPASSSLSNLTLGEEEVFHLTDKIASDAVGHEAMIEESSTCLDISILDNDVDNPVCDGDRHQGHLADSRNAVYRCTACLDFFSEEAYRDHICTYRTATFKPHCPVCYSQFEDQFLLQRHLEGSEAFSCPLCQTRCCSEEMKRDHLLSHPTCHKCGESFADNLALCGHVESDHPVIVCWDCSGVVVEGDDLELHYVESPAHLSCVICGMGIRNSDAMDEHVRHQHSSVVPTPTHPGGNANVSSNEEPLSEDKSPREVQNVAGLSSDQPGSVLLLPVMEPIALLGRSCEGTRDCPSETESTLFSSPHLAMPTQVEHTGPGEPAGDSCITNREESLDRMDVDARHYPSPSPTPSEHGSSHVQAHPTGVVATNNDTRASSPVLTVSADSSFSDTGRMTSSHSVVPVSANGMPEDIPERQAVLVATSADSPSSGRTPLGLPSTSTLESLDVTEWVQTRSEEQSTSMRSAPRPTYRLHCRICLKDPCEEMMATICGHVFCKRCITQAIVAKSECPVCKSAILLYCLFKLDLLV